MSTSILKALSGKLDIKRHSPSILYIYHQKTGDIFYIALSIENWLYILWSLAQSFSVFNFQAPFHVEIHKTALIVMDIHAHISKTEVIGMLGGKYCREQGKLTVSMATPCNSISTGMQCEMDPGELSFDTDVVEQGKLTVAMATPCNSISTGMQCEMDPGELSFDTDVVEQGKLTVAMQHLVTVSVLVCSVKWIQVS